MFSTRNIIILLIIATGIVGVLFLSLKSNTQTGVPNPNPTESSDIVTIQSDIPDSPKTESRQVHSADGKMNLIMENVSSEGSSTYTFKVANIETGDVKSVFTKQMPDGSMMQISQNAWSPDNKYFFITEKNGEAINYFVFRANGEAFSEDEQYISVVPLFVARDTGYSFSEITGWDSETLLHVFTKKDDGSRGPSFWFEIPSKAIIQLASR